MRAPWLGDILRDADLPVIAVDAPVGRGRDMDAIHGVVGHDTVTTTAWTNGAVDRLLVKGRPDLPGPLSQLGLDRNGRYRWVADGRCNHNGYGLWGNDAIAIEVYCAGGLDPDHPEPWNDAQREAFIVGARAICAYLRLDPAVRVKGHKETDPDRKVDPYLVDMAAVRRQIVEGTTMTPQQEAILRDVQARVQKLEAQLDGRKAVDDDLRRLRIQARANGDALAAVANHLDVKVDIPHIDSGGA